MWENLVVFLLVGGVAFFIVNIVVQSRKEEKANKADGKKTPPNEK